VAVATGRRTAADYTSRLAPLIEFAELKSVRRKWPLASDVDIKLIARQTAGLTGAAWARHIL